ncbi:hypothetical protein EDD15DRAFT_2197060 [Pisolithus albus]|nr:hypothetical protein EDD15DRAFT_2197060 [Pisolithus albus]
MAWLKGTGKVWYSVARGDTEGVGQRGWRRRGRCGTAWLEATRKVTKGDVLVMNIHGDSDAGGSGRTYRGGRQWGQAMGAGNGGRRQRQVMELLEGVSVEDAHRQRYDLPRPTLRATTSLEQQTKLLEGILVLKKLTERGRLTSEVFFPANMTSPATSNLPVVNPQPTAASPSRSPFSTEVLPPSSEASNLRTVNVNAWPLALPPLRSPFSTEVLPPSRCPLPPRRQPSADSRTFHQEVTHSPEDASVLSLHAALQGRRLPPVLSEGCSWTCLDGDPFIHSVPGQYIVVWASNYGSGGQSMPTSSMPTSVGWLIIQTCWYWGVFATMVSVWVVESLTMSLCYVLTVSILVQPFGSWYLWVIWL